MDDWEAQAWAKVRKQVSEMQKTAGDAERRHYLWYLDEAIVAARNKVVGDEANGWSRITGWDGLKDHKP